MTLLNAVSRSETEAWDDERESVVRDFLALLNDGAVDEMLPFLHPNIVFRSTTARTVSGRLAVLDACEQFRAAYDDSTFSLINIAVTREVVLVEQIQRFRMSGSPEVHWQLSFASFRVESHQITGWHQLLGSPNT